MCLVIILFIATFNCASLAFVWRPTAKYRKSPCDPKPYWRPIDDCCILLLFLRTNRPPSNGLERLSNCFFSKPKTIGFRHAPPPRYAVLRLRTRESCCWKFDAVPTLPPGLCAARGDWTDIACETILNVGFAISLYGNIAKNERRVYRRVIAVGKLFCSNRFPWQMSR